MSDQTHPLVTEMRGLAATEHPLCPEARTLLEMAVKAQETGKMPDLTPLDPNNQAHHATVGGTGAAPCSALPCPFCGNIPQYLATGSVSHPDIIVHRFLCISSACGVQPFSGWHLTAEEAASVWNTRSSANRVVKAVTELMGIVE